MLVNLFDLHQREDWLYFNLSYYNYTYQRRLLGLRLILVGQLS